MKNMILFVCTANICRSPTMAFTMKRLVDAAHKGDDWFVSSSGTEVNGLNGICTTSAAFIAGSEAGRKFAQEHHARPIAVEGLPEQDLIIVATRDHRAILARRDPELRRRTFTLHEALRLGEAAPTQAELALFGATGRRKVARGYAELLNGRRGLHAAPAERRTFSTAMIGTQNPDDIPDAHHMGALRHRAMLHALTKDMTSFHAQLERFASDSEAASR